MATEILELEVKSNIKGATKDMDGLTKSVDNANYAETELNTNIELQIKFLAEQHTELARLQRIQDSIPKGAFYAGQSKLNESILTVTHTIRDEEKALKKLQSEQKAANKVIRTATAEQKKSTNESLRGIQHFQIMGVSIRQLKHMVRSIRPTFKLLFGTIKTGIAATGVGLLILAFGALVVWLNESTSGAKILTAAFQFVGNVVNGGGGFSGTGKGYAQSSVVTLTGTTTDATPTSLFVNGDAAITAIARDAASFSGFEANVIGVRTGGGSGSGAVNDRIFLRATGLLYLVSKDLTVTTLSSYGTVTGWSTSIAFSGADLLLQVTGVEEMDISWSATVNFYEMKI